MLTEEQLREIEATFLEFGLTNNIRIYMVGRENQESARIWVPQLLAMVRELQWDRKFFNNHMEAFQVKIAECRLLEAKVAGLTAALQRILIRPDGDIRLIAQQALNHN